MSAARAIILAFERLPPREQKIVLFKLGAWFEFAQERAFHYLYPKVKSLYNKVAHKKRVPKRKTVVPPKHRFFHRNSPNFIWD